jgi:hypothetical protein
VRWKRAIYRGTRWACTLLAAALVVMLVGSRWWAVRFTWYNRSGVARDARVAAGTAVVGVWLPNVSPKGGLVLEPCTYWHTGWGFPKFSWAMAPWTCGFLSYFRPTTGTFYGVTLLYPVLLTGVPAAALWRRDIRERRRARAGSCLACGYDRRGLAADAKCPECGAVPIK